MTAVYENPEMVRLFRAYTNPQAPERDSTGDHLTRASYEDHLDAPLIVTTETHVALFAGAGAPPSTQGFRHGTLGFKELAGISHVGPAIASLVRLAELGREQLWRADAARLLDDIEQVRAANSVELWRDAIGAESFAGREERIAAMVDHACVISARYLRRALHEPGYLSGPSLRADLLGAHPVGFDRIMVATFALVGANNSARLIRWFDAMDVEWDRALVMLTGRQGRPTSGITLATNSLARIFQLAARGRLAAERIFFAPHAPCFPTPDGTNRDAIAACEDPLRWMLARVMGAVELAPIMYEGYPEFLPPPAYGPDLTPDGRTVSEMPRIRHPEDWPVMITRLRLALEDPRQLLASGVTDYMAEQLVANDIDPSKIVIPGLDLEDYPPRSRGGGTAA